MAASEHIGLARIDFRNMIRYHMMCLIVTVAFPDDHQISMKEIEKITNAEQKVELLRVYVGEISTKIVVPITIGALGIVLIRFKMFIGKLDISYDTDILQKLAINGSAYILRK